jgi:hypothetical protein
MRQPAQRVVAIIARSVGSVSGLLTISVSMRCHEAGVVQRLEQVLGAHVAVGRLRQGRLRHGAAT